MDFNQIVDCHKRDFVCFFYVKIAMSDQCLFERKAKIGRGLRTMKSNLKCLIVLQGGLTHANTVVFVCLPVFTDSLGEHKETPGLPIAILEFYAQFHPQRTLSLLLTSPHSDQLVDLVNLRLGVRR